MISLHITADQMPMFLQVSIWLPFIAIIVAGWIGMVKR
jgi:hypothetical protein